MIHELIDALCASVTIWIGYKIGYATHRADVRNELAKALPKKPETPYRSAANVAASLVDTPVSETKKNEYTPFSARKMVVCPKCGSDAKRVETGRKEKGFAQYCKGEDLHTHPGDVNVKCGAPHFTRACTQCMYSWFEATKDVSPPVDAPVLSIVPNQKDGLG